MSDKQFINEIKKAVIGEKSQKKVMRKLVALGFEEVKGKNGRYFFTHKRLGNYKVNIGRDATLSDPRWGLNLMAQIRHAMWKLAA